MGFIEKNTGVFRIRVAAGLAIRLDSVAIACIAMLATACLSNNLGTGGTASRKSQTGSGITTSDPSGGLSTGFLTLTNVVRTVTDPSGSFDLVGDGTGSIGQFCVGTDPNSGDTGPSSCTCSYSYTKTDGSVEQFDAASTYREANLLRCKMTGIPAGTTDAKVRIFLTTASVYSNEVIFRFQGSGLTINLSDIASFAEAKRYQCRDSIVISYLLDSQVYDPVLSDDPTLSYPLNFYSTNAGGAITALVFKQSTVPQAGGSGWTCPSRPNDPRAGLDLRIFSATPDAAGSKNIYPVANRSIDRSTFLLAKTSTGVFTVPVNAYIAPVAVSSAADPLVPPLGFGATPIPRANGSGEDCPTNITIPANTQWVKLWLFRGSLADRKVPDSSQIPSIGKIHCASSTLTWQGGAVHRACTDNPGAAAGGADTTPASTNDSILADRLFGLNFTNGMCLSLSEPKAKCAHLLPPFSGTGAGCTTDTVAGLPQRNQASLYTPDANDNWQGYARGTDVYALKPIVAPLPPTNTSTVGCGVQSPQRTSQSSLNSCLFADADAVIPHDRNPTMISLDNNGVSRFDYLFVVSPPSVMVNDFKMGTSIALAYTPYRFYSPEFCRSADPDNPLTPGDCDEARTIQYGFKFHDVSSNGDAPAGDPNRLPVFPVCALQPK